MYSPLRHAVDEVLRRNRKNTFESLDDFLRQCHDEGVTSDAVIAGRLAIATEGIIMVDRRTIARWSNGAE